MQKERKCIETQKIRTTSDNHCCQSIQKCWKSCLVKQELWYQNTIPGSLQLSETHGRRLCVFTMCTKKVGCCKNILTRNETPIKAQIHLTNFNSTKKNFQIRCELAFGETSLVITLKHYSTLRAGLFSQEFEFRCNPEKLKVQTCTP